MNKILSQIILFSTRNKKILILKNLSRKYLSLLRCFWKAGFIYGFISNKKNYIIYLKSTSHNILWKNVKLFSGRVLSHTELKFLMKTELNSEFFILTNLGFLVLKDCVRLGLGGRVFIKF